MKTKKKSEGKESIIHELRQIRDQIGHEIQDMDFEELKIYINKNLTLHPKSVWNKKKY